MNLPEGWPTEAMVEAAYDEATVLTNVKEPIFKAMFKAALAAAPTPPAQKDEPVSWRRTQRDCCDEYYTAYYDDEDNPPVDDGNPWEPLHLHPADDKLRKAAEELRNFVKKDVRWNNERDRLLANLDAALEDKPTPSDTDKQSPA